MAAPSVQSVAEAGVVGAGGAGFPTHVKLAARAEAVLLNAAECEPLLHKDKEILRHHGATVLQGLAAAMALTGAERGLIGIKEKYTDVMEGLGAQLGPGMAIKPLRDSYPAGDEMILVFDLMGRVVPPGGLPLNVGAVVMNVETAWNVARSPETGVTEKFVSVAGSVGEPCTLRVPVGVTLRQCVEAAGGATVADPVYLVGGVMMGRIEEDHDAPVTKTTGGVLVFEPDHPVIRRYRRTWKQQVKIGRSACDQCSFCTELCPRYLLGHPIEPHAAMRSLQFNLVGEANVIGTNFCCECNLCSMYSCPEDLDPKEVCTQNKRRLFAEGKRWPGAPFNPERPKTHLDNRRVPMKALFRKLGLKRFKNEGPLRDELLPAGRVSLLLKQGAGAPAEALVREGEAVQRGQVVARPPLKDGKPALGAPIHASLAGRVAAVDAGRIVIES